MPELIPLIDSLLQQMSADPERGMLLGCVCKSQMFPKFGPQVSRPVRERIQDKFRDQYEEAVETVRERCGEPYFKGKCENCYDPWQPLGWETACWERGEFVICVYWGQEDSELPFAVDVAVVRRDWDW